MRAFRPANHLSYYSGIVCFLSLFSLGGILVYFYILLNISLVADPVLDSETTEMSKVASFSQEPHTQQDRLTQ